MSIRTMIRVMAVGILLTTGADAVRAGEHGDTDATMKKAVEDYAAIADALAGDTTEGVPAHAKALRDMMPAKGDHATMHGEHGEHAGHGDHAMHDGDAMHADAAKVHRAIGDALETLSAKDTGLEAARTAFADLSAAFVPMAQKHFAAMGASDAYVVVHCPMTPGDGDWIQAKGESENPFHGSKMLRCGKALGPLGAKATAEQLDEIHGKKGEGMMKGHEGHEGHEGHGAHGGH